MITRTRLAWVPLFAGTASLLAQTVPTTAAPSATLYASPAGVIPSDLYEVEVNGQSAFVYSCHVGDIYDAQGRARKDPPETTTPQPAAFCGFDMSRPVDIVVRVKSSAGANLKSATVRPLQRGVQGVVEADRIRFTLPRAGQYSIEPNGSPLAPLLIFANPPETNVPQPDDPTVLYFGPGEHVIGWQSIKPGQNVYLAGGAVVYGHLIVGNADGTKIFGRGILDSSRSPRKGAQKTRNEFGRYDVQVHVGSSRNVLIEGITILDSPTWTLHIVNSTDITVRNVKIVSWRENGDGIDINNSQRVRVEDSFLRTWDDALVVKATLGRPRSGEPKARDGQWTPEDLTLYPAGLTRDVTFEDCVIWLDRAHALEIGFETNGSEISNIAYRNIDIIHDNHLAPIDITNGDRARVHNIRYDGIRIEDSRSATQINLLAGRCYTSIDHQMGLDYGPIEDVTFSNIELLGPARPRIVLEGQSIDPAATRPKIDGILFQSLKVNGQAVPESAVDLERRGLVGSVRFTP